MLRRRDPRHTLTFALRPGWPDSTPAPVRMVDLLPTWWRNLAEFPPEPDNFALLTRTVKGCRPMLDGLTAGWALPMPQQVRFRSGARQPDGGLDVDWAWTETIADHPPVSTHSPAQLGTFPHPPPYIKITVPWATRTPPGWSLLFQPLLAHDTALPFQPLGAIVDTDKYHGPVNLPCVWLAENYDGIVDAGTPIVQVIPFKREAWRSEIADWDADGFAGAHESVAIHDAFYRRFAWAKKSWGARPGSTRH